MLVGGVDAAASGAHSSPPGRRDGAGSCTDRPRHYSPTRLYQPGRVCVFFRFVQGGGEATLLVMLSQLLVPNIQFFELLVVVVADGG